MKIIVGLGNPGLAYRNTRHNVGFMAVEALKSRYGASGVVKSRHFRGWETDINGREVLLLKPKTFMNLSGTAVKSAFARFGGALGDYIIIHDDLDIPLGRIKITSGKGPGGHNGVISIIEQLGSRDFVRLRIGIGREKNGESYVGYVLSSFRREEKSMLLEVIEKACCAVAEILGSGIEKAMSLYNAE